MKTILSTVLLVPAFVPFLGCDAPEGAAARAALEACDAADDPCDEVFDVSDLSSGALGSEDLLPTDDVAIIVHPIGPRPVGGTGPSPIADRPHPTHGDPDLGDGFGVVAGEAEPDGPCGSVPLPPPRRPTSDR